MPVSTVAARRFRGVSMASSRGAGWLWDGFEGVVAALGTDLVDLHFGTCASIQVSARAQASRAAAAS